MGMMPLLDKQDQIANNLANINSTGYKQSGLFLKSYQKYLANDLQQPNVNREIKADEVYIDYSEGAPRQTNGPLDVFIKGSGFLTVMTPEGVQYTRNGNLSLDAEGFLVTSDGSKVMSKDGYISVEREYPIHINEKGELSQRGQIKAILKIVDFDKPYKLLRCGEGRFKPEQPVESERVSAGYVIKQGYLESSNVNVISNMVQMIAAYRNFEADQRALHAQDQTLDKAVNTVGRLS
ncbi:MAG: flagellar hook-basal body protein [Chitinispirillaceae bacterium]|nr:flagellar hook-basal body protein [Chitinispirillaceae bacterium]